MWMETTGQPRKITHSIGDWLIFIFLFKYLSSLSPIKVSGYISHAPIVHIDGGFFLFGGWSGSNEATIGRLDITTRQWTYAGNLVTARRGHNAIYDGQYVIVIGGGGTYESEKCSLSNNQMTCTSQMPELYNYYAYPELHLVPVDYCKQL